MNICVNCKTEYSDTYCPKCYPGEGPLTSYEIKAYLERGGLSQFARNKAKHKYTFGGGKKRFDIRD